MSAISLKDTAFSMIRLLIKAHLQTLWKISLLFSVLGLGLWYFLFTELGVRWTINLVNYVSPAQLEITHYQGSLTGPLKLQGIQLKTQDLDLQLEEAELSWSLSQLVFGTLDIDKVALKKLRYQWHPTESQPPTKDVDAEDSAQAPSLQSIQKQLKEALPVRIKIRHFSGEDFDFDLEQPLTIDRISFSQLDTKHSAFVKNMAVEGNFGYLSLEMNQSLNLRWDLNLPELSQWLEGAQGDINSQGRIRIQNLEEGPHTPEFKAVVQSSSIKWQQHRFKDLALNTSGTPSQLAVDVKGIFDGHKVQLIANGQEQDKLWTINLKPIQWSHPKYGQLPTTKGSLTLDLKQAISGTLNLTLFDGNTLTGQYKLDTKQNYDLTGEMTGIFDNFTSLSKMFPELDNIQGLAKVHVYLAGSLTQPKIWGNAHLSDVTVPIIDMGTTLILSDVLLESQGDGLLNATGKGRLGEGHFSIEGQGDFTQLNSSLELNLKGEKLLVSKTPEYVVYANPDLIFSLKEGKPYIRGNLYVPEASIEILNEKSFIRASSDVKIVQSKEKHQKKAAPQEQGLGLTTDITIELGPDVTFRGYQLETNLEGKLAIHHDPERPAIGTGKIYLKKAHYKAKGKVLTFTKGELTFAKSPLTNPALNIRAEREVKPKTTSSGDQKDIFNPQWGDKKLIVGINLTGTLENPELRFFSNPTLPQHDILSYLLLDKPQKDVSFTESQTLVEAATQMYHFFGPQIGSGGPSLTEWLQKWLPEWLQPDTLELQTGDNAKGSMLSDAVIVVGKQFSSRLYAEYSHGIMDAASSLSLRYLVGKHITLETKASTGSVSADLLFVFESG